MSFISIEKKDNFQRKNLAVIYALSKRLWKTQNGPYFPTALLCLPTHWDRLKKRGAYVLKFPPDHRTLC